MKHTLTTIIDIDLLDTHEHNEPQGVRNSDRRLLKLTLEWELETGGPDGELPSESDQEVRDEQKDESASSDPHLGKVPDWRDTISLFSDE